jgi:RNA polymerase sigma-70 factor (ECF subfamily)
MALGRRRDGQPESTLAWAAVLQHALDGDAAAARTLYRTMARRVHGYMRLQRMGDADDLTSETFLRVFRNLPSFVGDEAAFRTWVFTIAHRTVIDERRRAGRRPVVIDLREGVGPAVPWPDALDGLTPELETALYCLTAAQTDVVLLRIVADLSLEETARLLGRSVGAVKALQHRALDRLRAHLERHDPRIQTSLRGD